MLHIILHILAIIGIVILCILGFLIFLILLFLMCPIHYRISGHKQAENFEFHIKISYLFHILTAKYSYPEPGEPDLRILGIPLSSIVKRKSDKTDSQIGNAEKRNHQHDTAKEGRIETDKTANDKIHKDETEHNPIQNHNETDDSPVKHTKKDFKLSFLRHPILWIKRKMAKIYYTIKALYDNIKHIIQNITYYKDVLTDPANQALYGRIKNRLLIVLKRLMPKHLNAELIVGTGSPDTTGYLCGIYGMLLPVIGKHINMTADFDNAIFDAHFQAKGHISLMTILIQAVKVYFDKQVWIFIKQLKREE